MCPLWLLVWISDGWRGWYSGTRWDLVGFMCSDPSTLIVSVYACGAEKSGIEVT